VVQILDQILAQFEYEGNLQARVGITLGTGIVKIENSAGTEIVRKSYGLAPETWHYIEIDFTPGNAGTGAVLVYVNGVLWLSDGPSGGADYYHASASAAVMASAQGVLSNPFSVIS